MLILTLSVGYGCSLTSNQYKWTELIPEDAIALYIPFEGESARLVPQSESAGLFRQPVSGTNYAPDVPYLGVALMADQSTGISPVWILDLSATSTLDQQLSSPTPGIAEGPVILRQSHYLFEGEKITIYGNPTDPNRFYTTQLGDVIILSASPKAVEKFITQSTRDSGNGFGALNAAEWQQGDVILNPDELDSWAATFSNVLFHPALSRTLEGANPVLLRDPSSGSDGGSGLRGASGWVRQGSMTLSDSVSGKLTRRLTGRGAPLTLDRYISNNAAVYSILRIPTDPSEGSAPDELFQDSLFVQKPQLKEDLLRSPGSEIAFVGLSESGFQAGSEEIFIRSLQNPSALRRVLNEMVAAKTAAIEGRIYVLEDASIAQFLAGREFALGSRFYLDLFEDAVVISTRAGLTESVRDDASRRNVLRFHPDYLTLLEPFGRNISFIASLRSERFFSFITPWIQAGRLREGLDALDFLRQSGQFTLVGTRNELTDPIQITLMATSTTEEAQPYRELWVYPLPAVELSGRPVFADMGGSERPEILFSTSSGSVIVLAADGTSILQLSTGADTPVGSPIAYDWYGTRQNVLLQAAGSSVYGWDQNGNALPGFPIRLQERILSPLQVADVTRNGLPELILATADRKIHLLQARGEPVKGWPQTMNSVITGAPVLTSQNGNTAIFAVSQNTLHGWNSAGELLPGFPYFGTEPYSSEPVAISDNRLLLATSGGSLWVLPAFPENENDLIENATQLPISQNVLTGRPAFLPNERIQIPDTSPIDPEEEPTLSASQIDSLRSRQISIREDLFFAASPEGSLYLYNEKGDLRFVQSMGQAVSETSSPIVQDINRDQLPELISTGQFGRLFAWNIASSERILDLPANGMEFPVFTDLDLDQRIELIALTREGLRCWTLTPQ